MFHKAIDPLDRLQRVHAAAENAVTTLCQVRTDTLVIQDEDWELGSHRASCTSCVDLMALQHLCGSAAWAMAGGRREGG